MSNLDQDSGDVFLELLEEIGREDAAGLKKAAQSYGNSWKKRGGVGAFMMLARKWDRLEIYLPRLNYDIFEAIIQDQRSEGVIDDIRDLRRYLMLVEAEMRARGFDATHRDNVGVAVASSPLTGEKQTITQVMKHGHKPGRGE